MKKQVGKPNDESDTYYGEEYFAWQKHIGEFGAKANLFKFAGFVKDTDRVVEFGCGGGYLLDRLNCREKTGIEINTVAREETKRRGLKCYVDCSQIEDDWADVIISNSALEHVHNPLEILCSLKRILRPGGLIIFVVPHEKLRWKYKLEDINQHLYTWSPMCLGNLFNTAGFVTEKVGIIRRVWPPRCYVQIWRIFGQRIFELASSIYARLGGGYGFRYVLWQERKQYNYMKFINILNTLRYIFSHPLNRNHKLRVIMRFMRWQLGGRLICGDVVIRG